MTAMTRLLAIHHLSVTLPLRWLSGKTHELKDFGFGPISMSRALDLLHGWLTKIQEDPTLFLDEVFMMSCFDEFREQVAPFDEYMDGLDEENDNDIRCRRTGAIVANLRDVRDEVFDPKNIAVKDCKERMLELVPHVVETMLATMESKKQKIWMHLSKFGEEHIKEFGYSLSWDHSTPELKEQLMGRRSTNSITESALGATTQYLHTHGKIAITSAAAVSDAKRNATMGMRRGTDEFDRRVWKKGWIAQQEEWLADCLMELARTLANKQTVENRDLLKKQAEHRRLKREENDKAAMKKAQAACVKAYEYNKMYFESPLCIKDEDQVESVLGTIEGKGAKMEAVKDNFRMRWIGLGLDQFQQVRIFNIGFEKLLLTTLCDSLGP